MRRWRATGRASAHSKRVEVSGRVDPHLPIRHGWRNAHSPSAQIFLILESRRQDLSRRPYGRSIGKPLGTRFGTDFDRSRAASSVRAFM